jgi:hypothetical protein
MFNHLLDCFRQSSRNQTNEPAVLDVVRLVILRLLPSDAEVTELIPGCRPHTQNHGIRLPLIKGEI